MIEAIIADDQRGGEMMGNKRLCTLCLLILTLAGFVCANTNAAQSVEGTLTKPASRLGTLILQTKDGIKSVLTSKNVKVQRGQLKLNAKDISLSQLHCGDYIAATLNSEGRAFVVKASFDFLNGVLVKCEGRALVLGNDKRVKLAENARIFSRGGSLGTLADLKLKSNIACILNPLTGEAWEVYQTSPEPVATPLPSVKPKITSLQYSPLGEINTGDTITVEMKGSPGGKASFEIRHLTALISMKEITPGYYRGVVAAVSAISGVPLLGYLSAGGAMAPPMQAGRLVTIGKQVDSAANSVPSAVDIMPEPPAAKPITDVPQTNAPKVTPAPPPQAQIKVPVINVSKQPEQAQEMEQIVLKAPQDGAIIKSAITVIGKASPDSKVSLSITYTNGLMGLLKLSGNVAVQTVAVGKDGVFRMSPIALDGPLATKGLRFTIKAYYTDRTDHGAAISVVTGGRM
ncbi:MAG: hypothetical protein NT018_10385 [Armatimonadetes bacterium]|nr:hypothetical protein [Armatimonadota bacterium]